MKTETLYLDRRNRIFSERDIDALVKRCNPQDRAWVINRMGRIVRRSTARETVLLKYRPYTVEVA